VPPFRYFQGSAHIDGVWFTIRVCLRENISLSCTGETLMLAFDVSSQAETVHW
jgi:hypothetical protein